MIIDNKILLFIRDTTDSDNNGTTIIDDPWGSSTWRWGRWILFVIFVAFILILVIATARANRRRYVRGVAPIRGTSWLTPPSYRQSENTYVGTSQRAVVDYVPEYTEEANENDLGYYDERGEFHTNDKTTYIPPPKLETANEPHSLSGSPLLERPSPAVLRDTSTVSTPDIGLDFSRPNYRTDSNLNTFPGYFNNDNTNNELHTDRVGTVGSSSSADDTQVESSKDKKFVSVDEVKEF
ncbi:similar to Saccharomyces cerevisiae YDR003W RCR2 Vacuolar protein that presumably functions within the endosomal-vacuolar trafficking pathway [Maudiozyma barnettii]|uniref:Similar to Saccharomyces cerevisiae YDR003W RCR2 Vacuolar protein that presumably functions within the endosomal-vacuolar trafficking pathway n=1 Tax=Maudiozyma barnettii TaxID=61262 RepID=A0A8H2ZGX4_9SACH|nr:Rcr2p [Kazachstania barnettii]CAB4253160.1 similar to Saccharomyces cerevisiae YDR003W RCR2 Vacuolar protein that presumably functions within the endosomal-vacuolar trafficking pathway [Kazachstania barnettii]CAD1780304.1 similar to Saccharomyces cerevisiae YDR003W RCR2 Vacuolar protein that presumably functions within the endosomal-vacuolar trafficking pathway [Kazachstania barnettii]